MVWTILPTNETKLWLTPGVHDRLGHQTQIMAGMLSTASLTYGLAGQLLSESCSGGTLDGLSVTNGYDP